MGGKSCEYDTKYNCVDLNIWPNLSLSLQFIERFEVLPDKILLNDIHWTLARQYTT